MRGVYEHAPQLARHTGIPSVVPKVPSPSPPHPPPFTSPLFSPPSTPSTQPYLAPPTYHPSTHLSIHIFPHTSLDTATCSNTTAITRDFRLSDLIVKMRVLAKRRAQVTRHVTSTYGPTTAVAIAAARKWRTSAKEVVDGLLAGRLTDKRRDRAARYYAVYKKLCEAHVERAAMVVARALVPVLGAGENFSAAMAACKHVFGYAFGDELQEGGAGEIESTLERADRPAAGRATPREVHDHGFCKCRTKKERACVSCVCVKNKRPCNARCHGGSKLSGCQNSGDSRSPSPSSAPASSPA